MWHWDKKRTALERFIRMRNYKMDNMKGILIYLVVLGHMLEACLSYGNNRFLYMMIYCFHMPAFIFSSGYFAKFRPGRIIKNLAVPYVVFQTLYLLFEIYVLGEDMTIQFTKPFFVMWYLPAMMFWCMLLPMAATPSLKKRFFILLFTVTLSLICGYDSGMGRLFTASRAVVYLPFFLLGYYCGNGTRYIRERKETSWEKKWNRFASFFVRIRYPLVSILMGLSLAGCYLYQEKININWVYEACSYETGDYSMWFRGVHLLTGLIWTMGFLLFLPNKKLPMLSHIGSSTLPVFLLHGFFVEWLKASKLFQSIPYKTFFCMIFSFVLVVLLSFLPHSLFRKDGKKKGGKGQKAQRNSDIQSCRIEA